MLSPLEKLAYAARQGTRIAWYMGHYFASSRFRDVKPPDRPSRHKPVSKPPRQEEVFQGMFDLFARDLANVEAGYYPMPKDNDGSLPRLLTTSRAFFADLPVSAKRKAEGNGREVAGTVDKDGLPAYFLQNFHYQTGGYLTEESAKIYDMQVEVLFSGTTNAMRRQCLVPIAKFMKGRDQRKIHLADIACGTGRFAGFVKQTWPRMKVTCSDLSESYLKEARRHLKGFSNVEFEAANAENLPFDDNSLDTVTSIYLFHEVPPKVRPVIASEFYRILKPGGLLVFMDSIQPGDTPVYDRLLEAFPEGFHEPYYKSYGREDLPAIFDKAGFENCETDTAFLSKLVVCRKPERQP